MGAAHGKEWHGDCAEVFSREENPTKYRIEAGGQSGTRLSCYEAKSKMEGEGAQGDSGRTCNHSTQATGMDAEVLGMAR